MGGEDSDRTPLLSPPLSSTNKSFPLRVCCSCKGLWETMPFVVGRKEVKMEKLFQPRELFCRHHKIGTGEPERSGVGPQLLAEDADLKHCPWLKPFSLENIWQWASRSVLQEPWPCSFMTLLVEKHPKSLVDSPIIFCTGTGKDKYIFPLFRYIFPLPRDKPQ